MAKLKKKNGGNGAGGTDMSHLQMYCKMSIKNRKGVTGQGVPEDC